MVFIISSLAKVHRIVIVVSASYSIIFNKLIPARSPYLTGPALKTPAGFSKKKSI